MVAVIVRREVRDTLRDWRLVAPILVLTLFFPLLMSATVEVALDFVSRYGAPIIAFRLVPFLLMIVGFFPISFSLVIALETFVGERERNSLEPLLTMPISDTQLYLGKMLAAVLPPLAASYIGIAVYLVGLTLTQEYLPPFSLLVQIVVLTTIQALIMVAGAVVVSSHTTSVRAANLLASFIIVPMAILVQIESVIMFWGQYASLWWIALGLVIVAVLLVRAGLNLFSRELILSQGVDQIRPGRLWREFRRHFAHPPAAGARPFTLSRVYFLDLPNLIRAQRSAIVFVLLTLALAVIVGIHLAHRYQLPSEIYALSPIPADAFDDLSGFGFLPPLTTWGIFWNNTRSLLVAVCAALASFGVLAALLLMLPVAIIAYVAAGMTMAGQNLWLFLLAFVLPHGIIELPAAILATAAAVVVGMGVIAPGASEGQGSRVLTALADFFKVFVFLVLPLLLLAAFLEAHLTPLVVLRFYGS